MSFFIGMLKELIKKNQLLRYQLSLISKLTKLTKARILFDLTVDDMPKLLFNFRLLLGITKLTNITFNEIQTVRLLSSLKNFIV